MPAVIFDLDDTLVDYTAANVEGLCAHLSEVAPGLCGDGFAGAVAYWNRLGDECFGRYLRGELTFIEQRRHRARAFCERYGLPLDDDDGGGGDDDDDGGDRADADRWFHAFLRRCEAAMRPYPDVVPALRRLAAAGYRLGVLSNSSHASQDRKLRLVGLRGWFSGLVCCDDAGGAAKPDGAIFLAACRTMAVEPGAATYVGDQLDYDARAATAAGLRGIWLNRGGGRDAPDTPTIASLDSLPDRLIRPPEVPIA